jgi:CHAT domain-containing protein
MAVVAPFPKPDDKGRRIFSLLSRARLFGLFLVLPVLISVGCSALKQGSNLQSKRPVSAPGEQSAGIYEEKGSSSWRVGAFESAASNWRRAASLYGKEGIPEKQGEVLDKLSQVYLAIGQLQTSLETLQEARALAEKTGDRHRFASVLGHLGNVHLILGEHIAARDYLKKGLKLSNEIGDSKISASIQNDLGNVYSSQEKYGKAVHAYKLSLALSKSNNNHLLSATTLVNWATATMKSGHYQGCKSLLDQALEEVRQSADSHDKAYGLISIGLACSRLRSRLPEQRNALLILSHAVFNEALKVAEKIQDRRATSYALGYMGRLYEDEHRFEDALHLTRRAAFAAQRVGAPESLYRWQWQEGRLFKQLGRINDAISAYGRSIYTLQAMRQEMDRCYGNPLSSFRKTAGTVGFELTDLLLQRAAATDRPEEKNELLMQARDIVEMLRVYELRNYFKDDCVDASRFKTVRLDTISRTTAIIYPILLPDRTEVLVSLPSGLKQFSVKVGKEDMTREIEAFRKKLEKRTTWEFLPYAQRLYDCLIRPVERDLSSFGINTLVFVPGGPLRTVPMGALYDGKQFLIEKYATAITPGLDLTDPRPIDRKNIRVLVAGLSKAVQGFSPLPYVKQEMKAITDLYPCESLFNESFCSSNLKKALRNKEFTVLHIASHGEFQSDAGKTFLLTFDGRLSLNRLDEYVGLLQFRKEPLELLTLSACDTAAGDDLAALGIAGIAIKAGARSALATLWQVNDLATSILIGEFYRQIQVPSCTRAAALQRAQLKLLNDPRYEHPGYWSPFLMINNWL